MKKLGLTTREHPGSGGGRSPGKRRGPTRRCRRSSPIQDSRGNLVRFAYGYEPMAEARGIVKRRGGHEDCLAVKSGKTMKATVKYVHTNLVATNWRELAEFYIKVFGCKRRPPERKLKGDWLDSLTAIRYARIEGIHLSLPGYGERGPTLEIFQYSRMKGARSPSVSRPGFGHIAFAVTDVKSALARVKRHGGSAVGSLISTTIEGVGRIEVVYARDPEGNVVELQKWW